MTKKEKKQIEALQLLSENKEENLLIKIAVQHPKVILDVLKPAFLDEKIKKLYKQGREVSAIQLYRKEYGGEIRDAREYCDKICNYQCR